MTGEDLMPIARPARPEGTVPPVAGAFYDPNTLERPVPPEAPPPAPIEQQEETG